MEQLISQLKFNRFNQIEWYRFQWNEAVYSKFPKVNKLIFTPWNQISGTRMNEEWIEQENQRRRDASRQDGRDRLTPWAITNQDKTPVWPTTRAAVTRPVTHSINKVSFFFFLKNQTSETQQIKWPFIH